MAIMVSVQQHAGGHARIVMSFSSISPKQSWKSDTNFTAGVKKIMIPHLHGRQGIQTKIHIYETETRLKDCIVPHTRVPALT